MRIAVGVDVGGKYRAALNLAARLRLKDSKWTLVNCVDITMPAGGVGAPIEAAFAVDYVKLATDAGIEALLLAKDYACGHGVKSEDLLLTGNPAYALMQYAEDAKVDLVCVHSERKGPLGALFLGSTSRGLAIGCKTSVLISKGAISPSGRLGIVFATDHSPYANKALCAFLAMGADGVEAVKVVNALHLTEEGGHFDTSTLDTRMDKLLVETAERQTAEVVEQIRQAGFSCTGEVLNLPVNEAIKQTMQSTGADLLVMGAQGHGFMHRLILGSTSLHQVVAEPWPVLIVRPQEETK